MVTPGSMRTPVSTRYMGTGMQRARMREIGFYLQDSWRWKPNFTINWDCATTCSTRSTR